MLSITTDIKKLILRSPNRSKSVTKGVCSGGQVGKMLGGQQVLEGLERLEGRFTENSLVSDWFVRMIITFPRHKGNNGLQLGPMRPFILIR